MQHRAGGLFVCSLIPIAILTYLHMSICPLLAEKHCLTRWAVLEAELLVNIKELACSIAEHKLLTPESKEEILPEQYVDTQNW